VRKPRTCSAESPTFRMAARSSASVQLNVWVHERTSCGSAIAGVIFQSIVTLKRIEEASRRRLPREVELELGTLLRHADLLAGILVLDVPDLFAAYAIAEAKSMVPSRGVGTPQSTRHRSSRRARSRAPRSRQWHEPLG
jgi:hypothetical protein